MSKGKEKAHCLKYIDRHAFGKMFLKVVEHERDNETGKRIYYTAHARYGNKDYYIGLEDSPDKCETLYEEFKAYVISINLFDDPTISKIERARCSFIKMKHKEAHNWTTRAPSKVVICSQISKGRPYLICYMRYKTNYRYIGSCRFKENAEQLKTMVQEYIEDRIDSQAYIDEDTMINDVKEYFKGIKQMVFD